MSKIALISATSLAVDNWRRATAISMELAPWIVSVDEVRLEGPFSSVLCLAGWRDVPNNEHVYEYIVAQITAARLGEDREAEQALASDVALITGSPPAERIRPAATFPSIPPLSENERVLREFSVNPALIGMLEDEMLNSIAASIREPRSERSGLRAAIEMLARRRNIPAWVETISTSAVRQDALRIVQEFYGTNAHFETMNDSRLFACRDLARRGGSGQQMGSREVEGECRIGIGRLISEHVEEAASREAGFLDPDTGPPAERTPGDGYEPPAYREAPAQRAYSDPLRDHLRTYMQQERRTPRRRRVDPNDGF